MSNVKELISKYKIIVTIVALLVASFLIYLLVSANEDKYEDQITITNTSVEIIDGTANNDGNFDANDEAGNDSSDSNKIVRNFDQVIYNISYDLKYKDDSTLSEEDKTLDITRDVMVDIIVPTSIYTEVSESDVMNSLSSDLTIENNDVEYKYYSIKIDNAKMSETNNVEIILSKISGKNNDSISPIIRIREETENVNDKEITSNTNVSEIDKINIDSVTISAKEKYGVQLYQGVIEKDDENINSSFPVGIAIYIPNDSNKGIKGVEVPSNLSFNVDITSSVTSDKATVLTGADIKNYSLDSTHVVDKLPYSYSSNNGRSTVEEEVYLNQDKNSRFRLKFNNLSFNKNTELLQLSETESVYYISTKVFTFQNKRQSGYTGDIEYSISTDIQNSNTIDDYLDNYIPFIGDYTSKIDFFNSATSNDANIEFVDSGRAIYNYGEEFYIQNTINYGMKKGDSLQDGFTNYIKIDNTAIQLEDVENVSDRSLDYYIQFGVDASENYTSSVLYGLGEWNLSYFKLKSNAPSYCSSINNLSGEALKEELMNMYGGPCIETKNVEWVDSIQEAIDKNKSDKIIIFKLDVIDAYQPGVQTIVRLKAKAIKNYSNVGKTYQILARGETTKDNKPYYLSEISKISVNNQSQDLKYMKTVYSNNEITELHKSFANGTQLSTNIGNTILISPFKAMINPITMKDVYGSTKTSFYSGMTDPIEFIINPVIYKSDFDATIISATVSVYLPEQLEIYEKTGDKSYDRTTSGGVVNIDGINYIQYNYTYSESDINFENESISGTIPNLKVHAYISITTPDKTNINVLARISGTMKPNIDATTVYTDITPISQRTTIANLTLRNTKNINSIGKVNTLNIDKNGTYTYNMKAANSSDSSADLDLIYIMPYSGDAIGSGSKFSGTISVSINGNLPSGYTAMYTTDNPKTLLTNELNSTSSVNWKTWANTTTVLNNVSAIKIISTNPIQSSQYFSTIDGITLNIITKGNVESDVYYNNFYMIQKNADVCVDEDMSDECSRTEKKSVAYSSNISDVSVFNRTISGYVFEDTNYNGFYDDEEAKLNNIAVDLYKLSASTFDPKNPAASVSDNDTLVEESTTNKNGHYEFKGLQSGNYYVKYTFDCDKYTVTEKNKTDISVKGDASLIDSDAQIIEIEEINLDEDSDETKDEEKQTKKVCYAVSNIQTLNNSVVNHSHIDLGLRIRQEFDIKMTKYITNVKVTSNKGVQSYDYKNQSKVKIDIKNLKNTSFRVTYGIEIQNTRYFPGTIGNIVETIPEGMTFDPSLVENDGWYESDGNLYYSYLNKSLIMPGEKYHLTIVLDLVTNNGGDYINFVAANNLQIKPVITNFLEIPEEPETIVSDETNED